VQGQIGLLEDDLQAKQTELDQLRISFDKQLSRALQEQRQVQESLQTTAEMARARAE